MENKKRKAAIPFALLVVAMVFIAGDVVALAYSGSAQTHIDDSSSELITLGISKEGFTDGAVYTVDTVNDGTNVALSSLKANGSAATLSDKHFAYSGGFSLSDSDSGYKSAVAGTISLTVTQSEGATAQNYTMSVSGAQSPAVNQYGLSFIWTYKIGTGTETVFNPSDGIAGIDPSSGPVAVIVNAYVVYSESVPVADIGSIGAFTLTDANVTFTVLASTE